VLGQDRHNTVCIRCVPERKPPNFWQ